MCRELRNFALALAALSWSSLVVGQTIQDLGTQTDEASLIDLHRQLDIPRGDVNADGFVTPRDFLMIRRNFNQPGNYQQGDVNLDGIVDLGDIAIVTENFNRTSYQPEPEPREAIANLGLWRNGNQLIVSSSTPSPITSIEVLSSTGDLIPPDADLDVAPFSFTTEINLSPDSLAWGTAGAGFIPDGNRNVTIFGVEDAVDLELPGIANSDDLSIRWTEEGSYQVYSLGFGEGDSLTGIRYPNTRPMVPPDSSVNNPIQTEPIPSGRIRPVIDDENQIVLETLGPVDHVALEFNALTGSFVPLTQTPDPYAASLSNSPEQITLIAELGSTAVINGSYETGIFVQDMTSVEDGFTLNWGDGNSRPFFYHPDAYGLMVEEMWADLNNDGTVSMADFLILSDNFGKEVDHRSDGDIDRNGHVDFPDFLVLSTSMPESPVMAQAVPEPSVFALFFGCGTLLLTRQRCRGA